ncbi:MAG: hypothetical protein P8170_02470 [Gemmatimonadota bacterium]|jgi:hypothetical protein
MTVYDSGTIDQISVDGPEEKVYLGIVIPGPFSRKPNLIEALNKKVNDYVTFVMSGELARKYPHLERYRPYIEIAHAGPLGELDLDLVQKLGDQLTSLGFGLRTVDLNAVDRER